MKQQLRIALSLGFTVIFLWLALRNVDLHALGQALQTARYEFLIPAALCSLAGYSLRTVRWARILAPTKCVSFRRLFPILMIGFAANNVLPARIGEVARAYMVGSREGVSRSLALATIVVERVCDGLTLIALMMITFLVFPIPTTDHTLRTVAIGATLIFAVATFGLVALLLTPRPFLAALRFSVRFLPVSIGARVEDLLNNFLLGLHALKSTRALFDIAALSIGVWLLEAASFAFVLRAFPLSLSTSNWIAASTFLLVFVNLGIMIPSAPGYIGTYQFFATLALRSFNVAPAYSFGLAIVAQAMQYCLVTGIGLVSFWKLGMTPARLRQLAPAPRRALVEVDPATD